MLIIIEIMRMVLKNCRNITAILKPALWIFTIIIISASQITTAQEIDSNTDTSKIDNSTIYKAVTYTSLYYAGSIYILNNTWYKDKKIVPFHFYNDIGGYLQVDKFGHMYGSYFYSYIGYNFLLNAGSTKKEALLFGSTLGFILQAPIEIMDGIHEGYGFSWGDMTANALGSALVFGQELLFNEQIVKYKFSYWESDYSKNANGYLGETSLNRLLKDYNGHTYWFSVPINKLYNSEYLPDWLNIAFGYGANGMYGEFENIKTYNGINIPETERYRQFLLSLDIDWTKIKTNSSFIKAILSAMTFIKLPFPAVEYNTKASLRWYWLYY